METRHESRRLEPCRCLGFWRDNFGGVCRGVASFTLNGRGTNADGSTFSFHQNGHTVFDADGVPKLDFFKVRAHCP
jgi:hypothetical protein